MRNSVRIPSDRSGYLPRGGQAFKRPPPAAPPKPANDNVPMRRTPANDNVPAPRHLEDRLARSLGFKDGKADAGWQAAKNLVRKGKIAKGTIELILDMVELIDAVDGPLKGRATQTGPYGRTRQCAYTSSGPGASVPGYFTAGSFGATFCAQGQPEASLNQTIPNLAPGFYIGTASRNTNNTFPSNTVQSELWIPWAAGLVGRRLGVLGPGTVTSPSAVAAFDPLAAPILKVQLEPPLARPFGAPAARVATRESSRAEYGRPEPNWRTGEKAKPEPTMDRGIALGIRPGAQPVIKPAPRVKTPPRVRERKAQVRMPLVVSGAMNAVTETADFVDALWDALPERIKKREMARRHGKPPKLTDKMGQLYRHWYEVDLNAAIWNLLTNQLEDFVIGKLGSASKQATKSAADRGYHRRIVGPGTGPVL